jgi:hypothetical protein
MWPGVGVGVGVGITVAGVELNNNTALKHKANEDRFLNTKVTVAGVKHNNNTVLTTQSERRFLFSKPVEFSRNVTKMRKNSLRDGETVAGVELDNNTASTKQSER